MVGKPSPRHRGRERLEQRGWRNRGPGGRKIGRGIISLRGMVCAIDTDADGDRGFVPAFALDQYAGKLLAAEQEVVRPFDRQQRRDVCSEAHDCIMHRQRCDE